MINLPNEQQLFYIEDTGAFPQPSLDGSRWTEEKCEGYLHKHLTWVEMQAIVNPPKSNDELFIKEMESLNTAYQTDTEAAIKKVSAAVAWDGVTETTKIANARAELAQLKENYDTQSIEIINKYYGA